MIENFDELERFVDALPDEFPVMVFGNHRLCGVEGCGAQINGYYVTLQTFSDEGYHTKFVLFDDNIEDELGEFVQVDYKTQYCPACEIELHGDVSIEDHGVCYDCHNEMLHGERCFICREYGHDRDICPDNNHD